VDVHLAQHARARALERIGSPAGMITTWPGPASQRTVPSENVAVPSFGQPAAATV
jgi:hypothetical protein